MFGSFQLLVLWSQFLIIRLCIFSFGILCFTEKFQIVSHLSVFGLEFLVVRYMIEVASLLFFVFNLLFVVLRFQVLVFLKKIQKFFSF